MHAHLKNADWQALVKDLRPNVAELQPTADGWVQVDLERHAYALGNELSVPEPFFCPDGVWRTIHDHVPGVGFGGDAQALSFAGLSASARAWVAAAERLKHDENIDERTRQCRQWLAEGELLKLTECVCEWGGRTGPRVLGNLKRYNGEEKLQALLADWLRLAAVTADPVAAIAPGVAIKGLDVSYASKHLRILFPERHATLDAIVSRDMGFALSPAGYRLFIERLGAFQAAHPALPAKLGDLESGLFYLLLRGRPAGA